ncbi:MAG: hypothetical protein A3E74_00735 [Omnitrophica bacterium RIFCSPHIGHO2_12_FULL_44_12]|nr:MAG: hypothetical protein A3B72_07950 [Omnitrophica bacterium RIFCSPHIGHO2_02_FULL_45_28]OGW91457.1 MAG: hypothetical protein A3E74_00735 [Omnitrophica bacterium RIFCSPHIGHO2_12_FULL_44_12]OGX03467.1 MAG: hypothetical protein A3J12_02575 [Omnitrophica bacterium RIFCSPLOWO2_02_FULL_44_11]
MMIFRDNKLSRFIALLLLLGFAVFGAHFLHHDNDIDQCLVCKFTSQIGFVLFFFVFLFLKLIRERFWVPDFTRLLSSQFPTTFFGRAPPACS